MADAKRQIDIEWKGGLAFEAHPPSGNSWHMDAYSDAGGQGLGPTPLETFLGSIGACMAFDVMSILAKKRQNVTSYKVVVEGDRKPVEEGWPRPYEEIRVRHIIAGKDLDPEAVKRALQLSEEKYCSVSATIRLSPEIKTLLEISEA